MVENRPGILNDWDSEFLHDYRVALRFLEVFSAFFNRHVVRNLTDALKAFQDILGHLNDLTVQQTVLTHMLERMQTEGGYHLHVAASIGGLITDLARRHPKLCDDFSLARDRFRRIAASQRTRRAFRPHLGGSS